MHFALQQLTFQANDVATSLASGISPARTFAQQFGQIVQGFQVAGGPANALKAIGEGITKLFTPMKILGAGLITAGAGFALLTIRASSATSSVREFDVMLKGLGDSNLASGTGLEASAKRLRDVGLSASDARDKLREVTRAGLNPANAERVVRTGENLIPVLGDKATSELTSALSGGLEETIKFGLQLDVLKAKQIETWREMARGGQTALALNQAFAAIESRAKGLSNEALSPTGRSLRELAVSWSNLLDKWSNTGPIVGTITVLNDLAKVLEKISKFVTGEQAATVLGALTGAVAGTAVAGPAGAVVGGALGAVSGAYIGARGATGTPVATASIPAVTQGTATTAASAAAADAESMLGLKEGKDASRIREFLGWSDNMSPDQIAWCAAFANAALARHGISGTGSNVANSFLNWGTTVSGSPQAGDVLVQSRGLAASQTGGHVGLATGNVQTTAGGATQYEMVSGNSGATTDTVTKAWINANEVVVKRAVEAANSTVTTAASQLDLNALVQSVVEVESSGVANKVSPKGAQGLMQLMPATAAQYGVTEPLNGAQNVAGGTQYLKDLLAHYSGNVELALMAYNWGEKNLDDALKGQQVIPADVQNYSKKVIEGAGGLAAIGAPGGTAAVSGSVTGAGDIRRQRPEAQAADVTKLIKEEERQIEVLTRVGAASDVIKAKQEAATVADEKAFGPEQAKRLEIAKVEDVYKRVTAANNNAITATSLESLNLRNVAKAYDESAASGLVAENQAKATTEAYQQYGEIQSAAAKKLISSRTTQFTILEQNQFKETIAKQSAADRDQIENIKLETSLQGKTTEEITRQVDLQKVIQEAENKGLNISSEDVQNRLKVVDALDKQKEALAEAQRAQERLNSLVTSLVGTIETELTSAIEKAFDGEKAESWGKRINRVLGSMTSTLSSSLFLKPLAGTALSAVGATGLAQSFGTFDNLLGTSTSGSGTVGSSGGVSVEKSTDGTVTIKGLEATTSLTNSILGTNSGGIFSNLGTSSNTVTSSNDNIYGTLSGAGSKSIFNNTDSFLGTLSGSSTSGTVGSSLSSAGSSLFSLDTLKGLGAGFGAGTVLNTLLGGNKTTGTVGSGVGSLAGTLLGTAVGFPVLGGIAGGLLGGLGGLFGTTSKSSNATGVSIDLSKGATSGYSSSGSAENDKTLKGIRDDLSKFTKNVQTSTGGTASGYINPQVTDKGTKLDYNIAGFGAGTYNTTDSQDAVDVAEIAITKSLTGLNSLSKLLIDKYSNNIDDLKTALDAASPYKNTTGITELTQLIVDKYSNNVDDLKTALDATYTYKDTKVTDTITKVIDKTTDPSKIADNLKFAGTYDKINEAAKDTFASISSDLKVTGPFEKARDDIKITFDDITDSAKEFGLSLEPVTAAFDEANKRLKEDFNRNINDLVEAATDPLQSLVDIEKRAGDARVKEAKAVAGDIEAVNKLNAKNLDKIWTDQTKNIKDLRDEFKSGDLSGLTDYQRLPAARTKYVDTLAAVQGGDTSKWDELVTDAKNLFSLSKSSYGEGPKTAEWRTAITAVLDNVLAGRTFAGGTKATPPGTVLVGEQGPELISQPGRLQIRPHDETERIINSIAPSRGQVDPANKVERASNIINISDALEAPRAGRAFVEGTQAASVEMSRGDQVGTWASPAASARLAFAAGTESTPSGTILVGEKGPELVSQPGGLQVHPHYETERIINSMTPIGGTVATSAVAPAAPNIIDNSMTLVSGKTPGSSSSVNSMTLVGGDSSASNVIDKSMTLVGGKTAGSRASNNSMTLVGGDSSASNVIDKSMTLVGGDAPVSNVIDKSRTLVEGANAAPVSNVIDKSRTLVEGANAAPVSNVIDMSTRSLASHADRSFAKGTETAPSDEMGGGWSGTWTAPAVAAFATGTKSTPSGTILVGEKGPELISQPGKLQVHPHDKTEHIINSMALPAVSGDRFSGAIAAPVSNVFNMSTRSWTSHADRAFAKGTALAAPAEPKRDQVGTWTASVGPAVPAFAGGTKSTPPGTILVGEKGPELVSQAGGLHVYTHRETEKILGAMPQTHGYAVSQEYHHIKTPNVISLAVAREGITANRSFAAGAKATPAGTILVGEKGPELIAQPGAMQSRIPPAAAATAVLMAAASSNVVALSANRGFWQGTSGQYDSMMPETNSNVISIPKIMGFADGTSEQDRGLIAPPTFTASFSRGAEAPNNNDSEEVKKLLQDVVAAVNINNNISRRGHYETGQELRTQTGEMRKAPLYEPSRRRVAS